MWLPSITGQSGHINQSTSIFLPKKLCHSLSGAEQKSRLDIFGPRIETGIFLFASRTSACTCPLLTLSSTLFHSWMLDVATSHLIGGQSSLLWCDWLTPDPRSLHDPVDWPLIVCVQSVTMCVACQVSRVHHDTSHPDPVITRGDKICRASCNMSAANQGPGLVTSDQSEAGSASHIAWEAAVITINNNVLIRDPDLGDWIIHQTSPHRAHHTMI